MLNNYIPEEVLVKTYLGNTVEIYIIALSLLVGLTISFRLFQWLISHKVKGLVEQTKTDIDDTVVRMVNSISPYYYLYLAFYISLNFLGIPEVANNVLEIILIAWSVVVGIKVLEVLVDYLSMKLSLREEDKGAKEAIRFLRKLIKGILWVTGILFVLSNLGINITSLVAGLGIGGVAVALALQNILGDLFSSFAIFFDKPFVVGDFIVIGDDMGTVEKIGIKTTRLKDFKGEEIIISNKELTSSRIKNYKRMKDRRVVFQIGLVYDTTTKELKKAKEIVKDIIKGVNKARVDRVHFRKFGDSSLNFEVVYFADTPDYNEYMDIHEQIHLEIKERFEKEGFEMAYPTRTVYLQKE